MKTTEIYDKLYGALDSIIKAELVADDLDYQYFSLRELKLSHDDEVLLTAKYPEAGTKNAIVLDYLQTARSEIVTIREMLEATNDQG